MKADPTPFDRILANIGEGWPRRQWSPLAKTAVCAGTAVREATFTTTVADKSLGVQGMGVIRTALLSAAFGAFGLTAATAQVAYHRYPAPAATPYGIPVPFGFLQPNEELGTSPSFVVSTNPYAPGVGVVQRCQYPDGWNATDFTRDVNGIPNGIDHTCPVPGSHRLAY